MSLPIIPVIYTPKRSAEELDSHKERKRSRKRLSFDKMLITEEIAIEIGKYGKGPSTESSNGFCTCFKLEEEPRADCSFEDCCFYCSIVSDFVKKLSSCISIDSSPWG